MIWRNIMIWRFTTIWKFDANIILQLWIGESKTLANGMACSDIDYIFFGQSLRLPCKNYVTLFLCNFAVFYMLRLIYCLQNKCFWSGTQEMKFEYVASKNSLHFNFCSRLFTTFGFVLLIGRKCANTLTNWRKLIRLSDSGSLYPLKYSINKV